jgi:hypothetical protein
MREVELVVSLFPSLSKKKILFTPNFIGKHEYQAGLDVCLWDALAQALTSTRPESIWPLIISTALNHGLQC